MKIKNASDLKFHHEQADPDSNFFTRDTMKFFKDTMKNFGVHYVFEGKYIELRRRTLPHKYASAHVAYFDAVTFLRVHKYKLETLGYNVE